MLDAALKTKVASRRPRDLPSMVDLHIEIMSGCCCVHRCGCLCPACNAISPRICARAGVGDAQAQSAAPALFRRPAAARMQRSRRTGRPGELRETDTRHKAGS
eukprot:344150-Rhodomonas_salina.1